MRLRITTLSENTATLGCCLGEWGLSLLVENDNATILLDAGQSMSVVHNAAVMGIDLKRIERIVLSHGHFDHTGGLEPLLRRLGREIEIIAHPDIWADKYGCRDPKRPGYIGIPYQAHLLESLGARFRLSREPVEVAHGIMTTGEVPMVTPFEQVEPYLQVREDGGFKPDELLDDLGLIIKTPAGLVVLLGCAHRGIINTLYHAREITGEPRIDTVLGGCHLMDATAERVRLTIEALKELGVQRLGVSHCTGLSAACAMQQAFGERFFFNNAGMIIDLY